MKNEEKTTTYTASDLPEEIHSEEPAKDAETVKNAETESETAESEIVGSGSTESETTESAGDTEGVDSESATETTEAELSDEKEATTEEDSEDSEKGGFTRGKLIKIFAMEVLAFVIFIFAIIAWFSMNEETSVTGMQIKVQAPDGIYVSLGISTNHYSNQASDILELQSGAVKEPTSSEVDWTSEVTVDNYYSFGKMIPASSTTGEHIFFTPDAILTGRDVKSEARYFQADGYTDAYLKDYITSDILPADNANPTTVDPDSLAATAHPYEVGETKNTSNWEGYRRTAAWKQDKR